MEGQILVNTGHLAAGSQDLMLHVRQIEQNQAQLHDDTKKLVDSWVASNSVAGAQYQQAEKKLATLIADLAQVVAQLGKATEDAGVQQARTETSNQALFG
jgi:uncharacterized protein YukE